MKCSHAVSIILSILGERREIRQCFYSIIMFYFRECLWGGTFKLVKPDKKGEAKNYQKVIFLTNYINNRVGEKNKSISLARIRLPSATVQYWWLSRGERSLPAPRGGRIIMKRSRSKTSRSDVSGVEMQVRPNENSFRCDLLLSSSNQIISWNRIIFSFTRAKILFALFWKSVDKFTSSTRGPLRRH